MDQGAEEGENCAVGEEDVADLPKGGYGERLRREACELSGHQEEVVKVTVFRFEVCH